MKKLLSFALLFCSFAVLNAQNQICFKYDGRTYQDGETMVVALPHDVSVCGDIHLVNNTDESLRNLVITMTEQERVGFEVWALCTTECVNGLVSSPFEMLPNEEYARFIMDVSVDEEVAEPYGVYTMRVSNGTVSCSVVVRLQAYPLEGINPVANASLSAYPNPASGQVKINYEVSQPSTLAVYDMQGRTVCSKSISGCGDAVIGNLPAGVYTYGIIGSSRNTMQKLIVK